MPLEEILTDRDIGVLTNLYNFGTMKMNQILSIYYEGVQEYGRKRVRKLVHRGYIKRVGHLYRITDKGMCEINQLTKTKSCNLVRRVNKDNVMFMTELYTKLHNYNWKVTSSRLTKARYHLNRGCKIEGMIENEYTGEKYIVYILSKQPKPITIGTIKNEISGILKCVELNNIIMFYQSEEGYNEFWDTSTTYEAMKYHFYPPEYGISVLKKTAKPGWKEELAKLTLGKNPIIPTNALHADLIMIINGREYYVTEFITYDLVKMYHLLRYGRDAAELDGRPLFLITLQCMLKKVKELINERAYPHIRVADIADNWLEK